MNLSLFGLFTSSRHLDLPAEPFPASSRRVMVEALEERTLMSASAVLEAPAAAPTASAATANVNLPQKLAQAAERLASRGITSVIPLKIVGTTVQNGQLVLQGLLGGKAFSAPIDLSTVPGTAANAAVTPAATTQILNLHLGPIDLNLLGLGVKTSAICLDVSATSGSGNLLGNLLTDVANLLNGGATLGSILGGLTPGQLATLLNGVTGLFGGVFGLLTSPSAIGAGASAAATPAVTQNILHLSLGPVHLNLLGLNVDLDNCAGGPVTLDVTATTGPGNLLGNLLNTITHLLDNPSNGTALGNQLARLTDLLNGLA